MVIATLERGGAEKQLVLLATHLDRARFSPTVVALTRGGPFEDALREHRVPCEVIGKRRGVSPLALVRLRRLLRSLRPDVVHTWMFTADAYGRVAAKMAGVRRIVSSELCVDQWKGPVKRAIDRLLAHVTDCVVPNSDSVAAWLQSVGLPERIILTIPSAFDPAGYPMKPLEQPAALSLAPRLIGVGRLYPQKRYDVLVRAMAEIVREVPQAQLTILGEGPCRRQLEPLVASLGLTGRVEMPGEVANVPRRMAESDLLLMSSDYEGMPNAVLEAMYVGLPVVATAAPGTRDIVRDGETGVLVPLGDHEALARAALSVIRDPQRGHALAVRARREVLQQYTVERMVSAYEALYERLARADKP